jgi:8-oxo-dGTP pyrophosphatase MutT (NUDIX family)
MAFADSYLGKLRAEVGSRLLLMPGASVVLTREDGHVLLARRIDMGVWCVPGGSAEPGGSFARTAIRELREETGVTVRETDLVPFGTFSEAEHHTVTYPNGDVMHGFLLCFLATRWSGEPAPDGIEMSEVRFVDPADPPEPLHQSAFHVLALLAAFRATGTFQAR